jgi:hypothetical protein
LSKYWPQFKVLRQRYAGKRFEERPTLGDVLHFNNRF